MDKLFLIEGTNSVLINKEIDKILKDKKDYELIRYDLVENKIDNVIEDLDTYDMFLKQKIVIVSNPNFLIEKIDDFNQEKFLKYIDNPSDNILIIIVSKMNNRLKIVNYVKSKFNLIPIKEINYDTFVANSLKDYQIDKKTIKYFLDQVGLNYKIIENELDKLKIFKIHDKIILKSDIDLITNKNIENSIFDLIDYIIKKDKIKAYELYEHFVNSGTEIFKILVLLSNQIRLIYNVKILSYLNDYQISKELNVNEYPVKLARNKGYNYSKDELLNLLYQLAIIDEDIKTGNNLINISFLSFIMQM